MKVLANDGISQSGINALQEANFEVITTTVAQEQLEDYINNEEITVLLVRSATTVRKNIIDNEYVLDVGLGIAIFVVVIFFVLFNVFI